MTVLGDVQHGFLTSSTEGEGTAWARMSANLRRRLIAQGWPMSWLLSIRWISNLFDLCAFVHTHRRIPRFRKTHYINDYLFHIKTTGENLDLRRRTSDKELAKAYLTELLGKNYCVPTLAVIDDVEAVADYQFPARSIVKPTHMSGVVFRCGAQQPTPAERATMQSWFRTDYGLMTGERNYRRLKPKIIVEPFLSLNDGAANDVRFFVSQGKVRIVEVYRGRYRQPSMNFFDRDWNAITSVRPKGYLRSATPIPCPKQLPAMIALAERIGREFSFVRVDFFTDFDDTFFIGELTHIVGNCRVIFEPVAAERYFLMGID